MALDDRTSCGGVHLTHPMWGYLEIPLIYGILPWLIAIGWVFYDGMGHKNQAFCEGTSPEIGINGQRGKSRRHYWEQERE